MNNTTNYTPGRPESTDSKGWTVPNEVMYDGDLALYGWEEQGSTYVFGEIEDDELVSEEIAEVINDGQGNIYDLVIDGVYLVDGSSSDCRLFAERFFQLFQ